MVTSVLVHMLLRYGPDLGRRTPLLTLTIRLNLNNCSLLAVWGPLGSLVEWRHTVVGPGPTCQGDDGLEGAGGQVVRRFGMVF